MQGSSSLGCDDNLEAIKRAIESAGIEFIAENGGGPGVRLAKRKGKARSR
jgi:hypothetical protein